MLKIKPYEEPFGMSINAERCKRYREKKKLDSSFFEKERLRQVDRRAERSPTQITRDRATARERMRKYRELKKIRELASTNHTKETVNKPIMTRNQTESQRKKWRNNKRKYRASLSSQKKRRIREKDNLSHNTKREAKESRIYHSIDKHNESEMVYSPDAARKAVYRAKSHLPRDPEKFAIVLDGLISTSSPRKRKAVDNRIRRMTPKNKKRFEYLERSMIAFMKTYSELKQKRTKDDIKRRKVFALQLARMKKYRKMKASAEELGVRYKSLIKWSKLAGFEIDSVKRSDSLCKDTIKCVQDFYVSPAISVTHPGQKTVLKKLMTQKQTLHETYSETYKKFKTSYPEKQISESKFIKLKPKHVETRNKQQFRGCVCEKCANVELQVKAVNKNLYQKDCIKDKYVANKMTMCLKKGDTGQYSTECLNRECDKCGTRNIADYVNDHGRFDGQHQTEWYQWELKKVVDEKKKTQTSRKMLVLHKGSYLILIEEFTKNLEMFSMHLFHAFWQHDQFTKAKKSLKEGEVLCVMDFAENLSIRNQEECQSAHWYSQQVTIHPVVCYYLDPASLCSENKDSVDLVSHEMVYISDDLNHDSNLVEHCVKELISSLRKHLPTVRKLIQFTDGCSSQYKSKIPFLDISCGKVNHDIDIERHFFGSGHGKGPSDGCSGVVKAFISRALKAGTVLNTAEEVFTYVNAKLTKSGNKFCRNFFFVKSSTIDRSSKKYKDSVQTVKGTRDFHAVKGVFKGKIATRKLSCFCASCRNNEGECREILVDNWLIKEIVFKNPGNMKKECIIKETRKARKNKIDTLSTDDAKLLIEENLMKESVHKNQGMKKRETRTSRKNLFDKQFTDVHLKCSKTTVIEEKEHTIGSLYNLQLFGDKTYFNIKNNIKDMQPVFSVDDMKENVSIVSSLSAVDALTLKFMPDITHLTDGQLLYPAVVEGDGNCLPRSGSVLAFGSESRHEEIRARIVMEMIKNEDKYISMKHLASGREREQLVKSFTMYSDFYVPGTKISTNVMLRNIYRKEIMAITQLNTYMGIWQMCALATVLNSSLVSVYPEKGNPNVRKDLHRVIPPLGDISGRQLFLMWTTTRVDMTESHWIPNHFVPLLPMTAPEGVHIVKTDAIFDDDIDGLENQYGDMSTLIHDILFHAETGDTDLLSTPDMTSIYNFAADQIEPLSVEQPSCNTLTPLQPDSEPLARERVETTTQETVETPAPETVETPAPEMEETPAPETVETPAPEKVETTAPEMEETPAQDILETSALETVETPAQDILETSALKMEETPAPETVETPAPETIETPATEIVETPAPETVETPASETVETPAPELEETPDQETVETPAPKTVETPAPETVETPAQEMKETPAPKTVVTPVPETVETPSPETVEAPAPETVETTAPAMEETQAPETVETPAPELVEIPDPETVETPAPETEETPSPEMVETPASEMVETPAPEIKETPSPELKETPALKMLDTFITKTTETLAQEMTEMTPSPEMRETPSPEKTEKISVERNETPYTEMTKTPYPTTETHSPEIIETFNTETPETSYHEMPDTPTTKTTETPLPELTETPSTETTKTPSCEHVEKRQVQTS